MFDWEAHAHRLNRMMRPTLIVALVIWVCAGIVVWAQPATSTRLPPFPSETLETPRREAVPTPKTQASNNLEAKLRERGDLVLSETSLRQALFTISESWQINMVVGNDVSGQVNGTFKNAPLHEILHSILFANGYSYRIVGQGLVVMKIEALGDSNPLFVSETIQLRVIKPEDVLEGINLLRSPQGKVTAIASARSLMVVDLPERIAIIRTFVSQLDQNAAESLGPGNAQAERQIAQFVPQYVKAPALKESFEAVLSKDGKSVVIETENRVVVIDYPRNLDLVTKVMREVDVPRPQVRITALIYDVSLEDLERMGINWYHAVKGTGETGIGTPEAMWAVDSLTQVPVSAGTPAGTMTFMNLSQNFDIRATIEALCQSKDAHLLADPSVTVIDRESAQIQIVTEIPYQQLTQTQQGGNIGTTAFREAGVTLKVVPHIAHDTTVQMDVTPTFSRLTGFTNGQNPQPIIDKREAHTMVRVIDQNWLVIGGLRQRTAVKDNRGIPKLSSIKYLGKLFQAYDYSFRESELVVFLRPEIVTPRYQGREREQMVLPRSENWLEETPIAPHILGQGEVGCPLCGKSGCAGCANRPYRRHGHQAECQQPYCEFIETPPANGQNVPPSSQRLPSVHSEPPPAPRPPVSRPPSPNPPMHSTSAQPPVSQPASVATAPANKTKRTNPAATIFQPRDNPKTARAKPKTTATKKDAQEKPASTSWMGSWWK